MHVCSDLSVLRGNKLAICSSPVLFPVVLLSYFTKSWTFCHKSKKILFCAWNHKTLQNLFFLPGSVLHKPQAGASGQPRPRARWSAAERGPGPSSRWGPLAGPPPDPFRAPGAPQKAPEETAQLCFWEREAGIKTDLNKKKPKDV